ncbi:transmembrane protein 182 isoform X3 [Pygocentrus nattereri]|uniref:transmembrane protein 182 isoform X3 n=1 Tax=Pygocentrus nattereri TaxID=42514 RepID=UPI0008147405|nr:transmembrane protein 182 isoform X3 [Pygocentrus nattereri]
MSFSLSTMRLEVLQFIAGFCGALGSVFLLLSLGTDYWLLASESCDPGDKITTRLRRSTTEDGLQEHQDGPKHVVLAYHEGVFWRCSYVKEIDREEDSMLDFWITNQPSEKICTPAYLSQVPLSGISTSDSATVHRAFWCIMSVLGLTMVTLGVFVTICGIPTASRRLYEAGGALFITGAHQTPQGTPETSTARPAYLFGGRNVCGVGAGFIHSGTVRPPAQALGMPQPPPQRPLWLVLHAGPCCLLLLPAVWPADPAYADRLQSRVCKRSA